MQIKTSPLPQLPLELLVVNFCSQGQTFVPPTKILETDTKKDEEKINKKAESVPLKNTERKIEMTSKSIKTTLEQIKNKWEEIITELSETNHSLVFILKMCQLVSMRNGALCLAVPFAFHRDKLAEPKNKKIIEDKLADKFFEKIPLYCEVVVAQEADQSSNADLANIASQFGGEII